MVKRIAVNTAPMPTSRQLIGTSGTYLKIKANRTEIAASDTRKFVISLRRGKRMGKKPTKKCWTMAKIVLQISDAMSTRANPRTMPNEERRWRTKECTVEETRLGALQIVFRDSRSSR